MDKFKKYESNDLDRIKQLIDEYNELRQREFATKRLYRIEDEIRHIVIQNKDNKEIVLLGIKFEPDNYKYASNILKKDYDVVLAIVQTYVTIYKWSPKDLKGGVAHLNIDEELLNKCIDEIESKSEEKNSFYSLDGHRFSTLEEAMEYNNSLMNSNNIKL